MGFDDVVEKVKQAAVSGRDLVTALSAGESQAGQFRVKWLRRILIAWWWIAAILTAITLVLDLVAVIGASSMQRTPPMRMPGGFAPDNLMFAYVGSFAAVNLLFDLWAAAGLWYLFRLWSLRGHGNAKTVKAWRIVAATALVFGRTTGFFWSFLFALIPTWGGFFFLWPVKYVLLPPFVLLIGGGIELGTLYFAFTALVLALVVLPVKIFEAAFGIANTLFIVKAAKSPFFGHLVTFWYWFTGRTLPPVDEAPDESKGARFATASEIGNLHYYTGAAYGHFNGTSLCLANEKHTLIMASTRSGKGVSLIIPHLLRYPGSAFVLDPKGENARATGRQRERLNGAVYYLDPFGISGKPQARFNPLSRFTPENMEAESKALAAALVMGDFGKRDHWTASAQQLLAAFILYVFAAPDIPKEEKDLGTVRRVLLGSWDHTLNEMANTDLAGGLVADLAASFRKTPEKELGSIVSTAQRETEILDNPFIIKCLSASGDGDEVDFKKWRNGTMSVFLCLSAPKFPVFSRWLRLVLTSALDEMTDTLNPPPLPVCFMLDELATLGHLQAVENAVGLAAGYGIQLWAVFQDVAQMKDLYKGRWASFIGNAGVRAVFSLQDYDTARYWSDFIGRRLVETRSTSQNIYGLAQGQSVGEAMRPLMAPEEIMLQFAQGQMLVLPQASHPIVTRRIAYWDDKTLEGLWDDPRKKPEPPQAPKAPAPPAPPAPVAQKIIVPVRPSASVNPPEKATEIVLKPSDTGQKPSTRHRDFGLGDIFLDPKKGGKKPRK